MRFLKYFSWLNLFRGFMEENPGYSKQRTLFLLLFFYIQTAVSILVAGVASALIALYFSNDSLTFMVVFKEVSNYLIILLVIFSHLLTILYETSRWMIGRANSHEPN